MEDQADELAEAALARRYEVHSAIFSSLEGAAPLLNLYEGRVPTFHDAHLQVLHLSNHESSLRIWDAFPTIFSEGRLIVTLHMREILDVELNHFVGGTGVSILFGLYLRPAISRAERSAYMPRHVREGDVEIEIETSFGLSGSIVASGLSISSKKSLKRPGRGGNSVPF